MICRNDKKGILKMENTINLLKVIEFQREFINNAIKQITARSLREVQRMHKEELRLTPDKISIYLKRLRISLLEDNLLGKFIDGFV